ncbi:hypothetical protein Bca4012_027533 [Brassica carinata]|uniref:Uncharacterized protein n=1 Tax=Brassica carinata TaxID=52824 RepID=A0A8X7VKR1_BRACI|nr:hypothetical protein Bca52824_024485 [Brassica carinata]
MVKVTATATATTSFCHNDGLRFSLCWRRTLQLIAKLSLPHRFSPREILTNGGRQFGAAGSPIEIVYVIVVTLDPRHLLR